MSNIKTSKTQLPHNVFTVYFSEKYTSAYNSVNFSLNFTKFGMDITHVPVETLCDLSRHGNFFLREIRTSLVTKNI